MDIMEFILTWLKRDWYYIFAVLIALCCILYLNNNMATVLNDCNEHWIEQNKQMGCGGYDIGFTLPILDQDGDIDRFENELEFVKEINYSELGEDTNANKSID